jgi:hypothetical protein
MGLREPMTAPARLLLAYCVYWWASFAKGYVLEAAVKQDLTDSGVEFQAHNLLDPAERFAPYDLLVSEQHGDIKTSTYFLFVALSFPLRCELYITRTFDARLRQWRRIVLLKRAAWDEIDGESVFGTLEHALSTLTTPVEFSIGGEALVMIDYNVWKGKIRAYQAAGGNRDDR